jgi:hypothetical protein
MKTCATPGCTRQYTGPFRHCRQCGKRLNEEGLCCWCGEYECEGRSRYCAGCLARIQAIPSPEPGEILPETPQPKYRDADAQENTRETKRGKDG